MTGQALAESIIKYAVSIRVLWLADPGHLGLWQEHNRVAPHEGECIKMLHKAEKKGEQHASNTDS